MYYACFFISLFCPVFAADTIEIVVAKDGSGNFTSIQAAIDSVPANNTSPAVIIIKDGTYKEKIFITKSFISLVGENIDSTRIVYAELRKNWKASHNGSDWGSAVVNIDSTVTNLTIANLTIHNNYGSLYGDHDHQFAVWGLGTKIILLYCNIISDGGDALSLWNKKDGMYFHSNCYFEGWVDYVCPRGWCYITDSRFYGHNLTASLWHDGDADKDQKFVIRYSYFDGVPGFPLGRHHRDGQFYFLDCIFSKNLADEQIHYPDYSPNAKPWKWGARHYYYNCYREGGDYDWFKDNLSYAQGAPLPEQIDARWTFDRKWAPENTMQHLLPFVSHPLPRNGSSIDERSVTLRWLPSRNAKSNRVYFGTLKDSLQLVSHQIGNIYKTKKLPKRTRYFWRIDEFTDADTLRGNDWSFTIK